MLFNKLNRRGCREASSDNADGLNDKGSVITSAALHTRDDILNNMWYPKTDRVLIFHISLIRSQRRLVTYQSQYSKLKRRLVIQSHTHAQCIIKMITIVTKKKNKMKRKVISLAIVALVCCGDLVEAAPALPRLRGRGRRRGPKQELCIDLGRRYGKHTFAVSSEDARWFRSRGATRGACKQAGRRARKRQQRVRAFCIDIENDQRTLYAPKVATRWLLRRGASMGACTSRASVNTMEMNLKDTKINL